jgi:hypothetical protein
MLYTARLYLAAFLVCFIVALAYSACGGYLAAHAFDFYAQAAFAAAFVLAVAAIYCAIVSRNAYIAARNLRDRRGRFVSPNPRKQPSQLNLITRELARVNRDVQRVSINDLRPYGRD